MTPDQHTRLLEIVRRVVTSDVVHPVVREFYAEYLMGRELPAIRPLLPLSDGGNLRGFLRNGVALHTTRIQAGHFLDELDDKVSRYIRMRSLVLSATSQNHEETNDDDA